MLLRDLLLRLPLDVSISKTFAIRIRRILFTNPNERTFKGARAHRPAMSPLVRLSRLDRLDEDERRGFFLFRMNGKRASVTTSGDLAQRLPQTELVLLPSEPLTGRGGLLPENRRSGKRRLMFLR